MLFEPEAYPQAVHGQRRGCRAAVDRIYDGSRRDETSAFKTCRTYTREICGSKSYGKTS